MARSGKRQFTADEDRIIGGMVGAGCTIEDMAYALGRSASSVKHRYRKLRDEGECLAMIRRGGRRQAPDADIEELIERSKRSDAPSFIAECNARLQSGELALLELALIDPPDVDLPEIRAQDAPSVPYTASLVSDGLAFDLILPDVLSR